MHKFELKFKGKRLDPRNLGDAIQKAALESIAEHLRKRIGAIRDPETGEFPTIVVSGNSFSDLRVDKASASAQDTLTVSVTVANTGTRAGKEVVQLYSRDHYASLTPSARRLRDFTKVSLGAGERRTVTFRLPVQSLAFIGLDDTPVVEPGGFDLIVGELVQRITVR